MTSLPDRFRVCAAEHIDNVTQPKSESVPGVDAIYAGKKFLRVHRSVECLARLQTIVATLTRTCGRVINCFAKILQKHAAPAFARLGVMDHLLKLCTGDTRLLLAFFVDEMQLLGNIARAEQQDAFARQSVASGASGLLVIALQIFRQIVMHNKTHVWFIDAHSERDGGSDHAHVVAQKCILMFCAFHIR